MDETTMTMDQQLKQLENQYRRFCGIYGDMSYRLEALSAERLDILEKMTEVNKKFLELKSANIQNTQN